MTTIFWAVVVLGVLIFVHELGHFLVAKRLGVGVLKFSLGFGPKLVGRKVGETEYLISAVPLGGYVKMVGEQGDEETPPEDIPRSFAHKSVGRRIAIVAAGPLSNMAFAVLILAVAYVFGIPALTPTVGNVIKDSPAAKAGLQADDRIVAVDGRPIVRWEELFRAIGESQGRAMGLAVRRGTERLALTVTPEPVTRRNLFNEEVRAWQIGVAQSGEFVLERVNPLLAVVLAAEKTWQITRLTIVSLVKLVQGVLPLDTIGGPILIVQQAGQQAQAGPLNLVFFAALISINLGILNLLPIPILDGGHLLFFMIESIKGKPLSVRKREMAQQIGLSLLILLMGMAFYNDIRRFWNDILRLFGGLAS
ncbi:MAG: RIP metalloprotease RseP [Deltaproteobacteria bacterium]|nr:RIP metalloprotease RseP [Deltaproteobacteria bacterium]MBI3078529.1 RIP metalloprotease RseP [Deltaproteobacteria bacterium]